MAQPPVPTPLVLRPEDPTARKGALLFAALAGIGAIGLVVEIATGNVIGAVAAAVVALIGIVLTVVVVIGRTTMRVTLDADSLQIAGKRLPRTDIAGLRRRPIREGGLDVVGRGDGVLYSMPGWFDAAQEQQLAVALGVVIVEPPPPAETDETGDADEDGEPTA